MPALILTGDTLSVRLVSQSLEVLQRFNDGSDTDRIDSVKVPLIEIERVVIVGQPGITLPVLARLMDRSIPVFFVTRRGRWRGSLLPDRNLNAGRRITQYQRASDEAYCLQVAKKLVNAKIRNSRRVLQRLAANRGLSAEATQIKTCNELQLLGQQAKRAESLNLLRGYEGAAAAAYFERLRAYFTDEIPFMKRSRRPPRDPANALLSFAYTVLLSEMEGAVRSHGLDAAIGCLHADRHNSPSLALDLIEPLRPALADLLVMNIVSHKMVKPELDFEIRPSNEGTYLSASGRKTFFGCYEQALTRTFRVKKDAPRTTLRQVLDQQVTGYLRMLEKDEDFDFFQLP